MKLSFKNISKPTSHKMKRWGNSILLLTSGLATLMMGSPFSAETISWIVWGLNTLGVITKFMTSMTTSEPEKRLPEYEGDEEK